MDSTHAVTHSPFSKPRHDVGRHYGALSQRVFTIRTLKSLLWQIVGGHDAAQLVDFGLDHILNDARLRSAGGRSTELCLQGSKFVGVLLVEEGGLCSALAFVQSVGEAAAGHGRAAHSAEGLDEERHGCG